MTNTRYLVATLIAFFTIPSMADDGQKLFEKYCIACHQIEGPPQVAPPVFGVINHVKERYPEREAFIQRIVEWVGNPNSNDSLMPGAIRRFGVMPKMDFPRKDVRKIAAFLYDQPLDLPQWYIEHYQQQHGKKPAR
jgi:mono/diheme cytochrome c family protein